MEMDHRKVDDIIVIELAGKIMGGSDSATFHEHLNGWLEEGYRKYVIDLGEVDWMNSSGLGILISGMKAIQAKGGHLRLARITEKIKNILVITKLLVVFRIHDTVNEAIGSF
jgi:anti-sigma B factor antagonist